MKIKAVIPFLLCSLLLGCGIDFEPYWRIDKLRVMAIQADPLVAPYLEPVTLSAAVYAPDNQDIRYHWSWCPIYVSAQDGYACPIDEADLGEFAEGFDTDALAGFLDLGQEPTATFVNVFEEEQVNEFCESIMRMIIEEFDDPELAGRLPVSDCSQGYEISIRLEVQTDDDSIIAAKRMLLHTGADEVDKNPRLEDFLIRPEDPEDLFFLRELASWEIPADADHDEMWLSTSGDEPLTVVTDVRYEILGLVDRDSILIEFPDDADDSETQEKALDFRYFTTTGSIHGSSQFYSPRHHELDESPIAPFSISSQAIDEHCQESTSEGCLVRIWSMVRDADLGVDWLEGRLLVRQ